MISTVAADVQTSLHYSLRCLDTGESIADEPDPATGNLPLSNPRSSRPALLRTEYRTGDFVVGPASAGLYRFRSWMPIRTELPGSSAPISFHSVKFGRKLGLDRLFVVFSGYWPERGVAMATGTFKETEAYTVFGRRGTAETDTLVIASAGNTARAFLHVASQNDLPLVVVVPENSLTDLWTPSERSAKSVVIAAGEGADYTDAIYLADQLVQCPGYRAEGGARNVGRRDGMGTTFLTGVHDLGAIPDHYFQAVGSGTGAIAAWEANLRLIATGRFGSKKARLHLAQNSPFQILTDSWTAGGRELAVLSERRAKEQIAAINAKVLANRTPPYTITGGLFDALTDTRGEMYAVDNALADSMASLFCDTEGIELDPASAVACGALVHAVSDGEVANGDTILLNVTGGGSRLARKEIGSVPLRADIVAPREMWNAEAISSAVETHKTYSTH